jgi:glycosyltransferase involved in cell wall biosynthesis
MACGTPVIASRVGGLAHTVQDGITGYLVPESDAGALADHLQCLLADEEMRLSMGRNGARAAKDYSWPAVTDQVQAIYEELAVGQAAPSEG